MPSNDLPFPKYPAFQPMFAQADGVPVPLYLTLLNLGEGSEVAVAALKLLMETDADLTPQIVALLDDFNWRPQLVGAVAMALGAANKESCAALWRAFDGGSWVSPQLAAVAFLIDDEFEQQARQRAEANCPISRERLEGLDWVVRHSAAGPGSFVAHSSKALMAREDIQKSLRSDGDGGGRLATGWLDGFASLRERRR